ncbi:MAG: hypothetical protein ACOX10_05045 [Candidatus Methanomethylophilaceae archaeon]
MAKSEIVSSEIIMQINNISRNTAYFFPEKKKRSEYNCNVFRGVLDDLLSIWNTEVSPLIEYIRTPDETEHKAYVGYISDGGMDHDEARVASVMQRIKRTTTYNSVLGMIYGQYIHLIGSVVEYSMIKVLEKNGHSLKRIGRGIVSKTLRDNYGVKINEIPKVENYNKFYALWNFLKHNSISSYKNIKEQYPEILNGDPFENGRFALQYVNLDEAVIIRTLKGLREFFDSFSESVFDEDIDEACWNYDEYFLEKYKIQRGWIVNHPDSP